jgi:NAD/NADP transhydrogenase alpha subunit
MQDKEFMRYGMREYDLSKFFRRPDLVENLRKNGYKVTVTDGDGEEAKIVREYFVTPEEVQARDKRRKNQRVQSI